MNSRHLTFGMMILGAALALLLASPGLAALVTQTAAPNLQSAASGMDPISNGPTLGSLLGTAGAVLCLGVLTIAGLLRSKARTA
jgi:hypothetical protein